MVRLETSTLLFCPTVPPRTIRGATHATAAKWAPVLPRGSMSAFPILKPLLPFLSLSGSCAATWAGQRGREAGSPQHPFGRGLAAGHCALLQEKNGNESFTDLGLLSASPPPPHIDSHPSAQSTNKDILCCRMDPRVARFVICGSGRGSERRSHGNCSVWLSG